ncbi:MAG: SAP domain-containing protein [Luteolibacter sp.]
MKFERAVETVSTKLDLKRFASAHVVDHRNLREEEIIPALLKTAPQYFHFPNIEKEIQLCLLSADPSLRILTSLILKEILIHQDDFLMERAALDEEIIRWEQSIIDQSNEDDSKRRNAKSQSMDLFRFVVETAWEMNDDISPDEKNLIDKIAEKLKITEREFRTIEATLGKYPKAGNETHLRTEIDDARKTLQGKGLLISIRDENGMDYDLIPEEVAYGIRKVFGIQMRKFGYGELLSHKRVRSKEYYLECLKKAEIPVDGNFTNSELRDFIIERVPPSLVLGGIHSKDGLSTEELKKWCQEISEPVSGTKEELISRIITHYDNIRIREDSGEDERAAWFSHFEELARRDAAFFRSQNLIGKDIEIERRFEEATNYMFEVMLGHKPLKQIGSDHADGSLSMGDTLILWDNKSTEQPVSLAFHIKQFKRYIESSEKRVAGFLVIGPDFREDCEAVAMDYFIETGMIVTLAKAADLKSIAVAWSQRKQEKTFPLRSLVQQGLLRPELIRF